MDTREVQVVILSGPEAAERAVFGLSTALAAASSGIAVRVVLGMRGAHWAAANPSAEVAVADFPSVAELIDQLIALMVPIEACETCADNYCPSPVEDSSGRSLLRAGVARIGLGSVAIRMARAMTVLC